ncbi:MAG: hypothetical protein HY013_13660, partial [Candidatus Solibacter usitatus]|nr:hypothetical protein [Candidatus Solibacter usitatus]
HLSFDGIFGTHRFNYLAPDSPWLFFDGRANAFLISPLSHFGVAALSMGGQEQIRSGISPAIKTLPAGFTHQTILVIERGINKAFETWGQAITGLYGKTRPANDADVVLDRLGYWTDAGAAYYYRFEEALGYEGTLLAVRDDFARAGIALGYLQLDSWFYPKGPLGAWEDFTGGIHEYVAHPSLFPRTLASFRERLGLPLITHARWIDPASPYRRRYEFSGNVSTDPLYWDNLAAYLREAGVASYEQDWLGAQAQPALAVQHLSAFTGQMARALREQGISIQYCMPAPRHFLQTARYDNVTTIRVSEDRFDRNRWDEFLYGSRLASALGVWPWSDVFRSTERDNTLLSTLSAGPLGVGDPIGGLDRDNLLRAVRPDGVIVKPDVAIVPLDQSILDEVQAQDRPMVAAASTDFEGLRFSYVFAYPRGRETLAAFTPDSLGLTRPAYVYNYFTGEGRLMEAGESVQVSLADGSAYYIVAPIGDSGIAFLGDAGHFVSVGKKRIPRLSDTGTLEVTVAFARGEKVRVVRGYAPSAPSASVVRGAAGPLVYDPSTRLFRVEVSADEGLSAVLRLKLR